jgi:hypothetical protein
MFKFMLISTADKKAVYTTMMPTVLTPQPRLSRPPAERQFLGNPVRGRIEIFLWEKHFFGRN